MDCSADEVFNDDCLRRVKRIEAALRVIHPEQDMQRWLAALAVYVGFSIREACQTQNMSRETAQMLVECVQDVALSEVTSEDAYDVAS